MTVPTLFDTTTPVPAPAGAGPTPLVIGLDLSLRSTGLAGPDWTDAIRTGTTLTGPARIAYLRREIRDRVKAADLAVVEGPSHGSALQQGHHEMAGLWWAVVCDLYTAGIPYAVVPPTAAPSTPPAKPDGRASGHRRSRAASGTPSGNGTASNATGPPGTTAPTPSSLPRWAWTGSATRSHRCPAPSMRVRWSRPHGPPQSQWPPGDPALARRRPLRHHR
jgi:hypothetical protein